MIFAREASELLLMIIVLEILSWLFAVCLGINLLKYLIVQVWFFILRILGVLWSLFLLQVSVIFKVGVPPFHLWLLHILKLLEKYVLVFILTVHKLVPLVLLAVLLIPVYRLLGAFIGSILLLFRTTNFITVLLLSSFIHSYWALLGATRLGSSFILVYWALYGLITLLIFTLKEGQVLQFDHSQGIWIGGYWLILSGIPPFVIFWLKLQIINGVITLGYFVIWSILLLSPIVFYVYLRVYLMSFSLVYSGNAIWGIVIFPGITISLY